VFTLGPEGTDAEAEATRLFDRVALRSTFPEAMAAARSSGGLALIAAGFLAASGGGQVDDTWADLHFRTIDDMAVVDVWCSPTKPMGLGLHRSCPSIAEVRSVALYPATRALAASVVPEAEVLPVRSKPEGVVLASTGSVDACIGSVDMLDGREELSVAMIWQPSMIWILYAPVATSAGTGA
jgi:hypothetical protein